MTRDTLPSNRTFQGYLILTIKGFCMGAADVVPGVSGGTMAFILGIYEELVKSIRSFDIGFLRSLCSLKLKDAFDGVPWQFVAAVGMGIFVAIFTLARMLSWLLQNRPVLIWSFFFGLIVASVFAVSRNFNRWSPAVVALIGFGSALTYFLVGLVPASTPDVPWFLFLSGAIAICAMILPGISGAFILVLMGKYHYVLDAVNNRDIFTLFLVAAGAAVGLVTFARLLHWLFDKYHDFTMAVLTGLMLGSLRKVWPWKEGFDRMTETSGNVVVAVQENVLPCCWDTETGLALSLGVFGFLLVFSLNFLAKKGK